MHALLNIAVRAARRAGDFAARNMGRLNKVEVVAKGRNDFVSDIDRAAERDIIETIRKAYPHHAVGVVTPIDAALAARWTKLAGVTPTPDLQADGKLTRGEFLNRLYAQVNR